MEVPAMNAEWLKWHHGILTFRLTQVMIDHGCFDRSLCRVGWQEELDCFHLGGDCHGIVEDTALRTPVVYPCWTSQCHEVVASVGL